MNQVKKYLIFFFMTFLGWGIANILRATFSLSIGETFFIGGILGVITAFIFVKFVDPHPQ